MLRTLVRVSLDDGSYRFAEAGNGDEALAAVRAKRPDLIVLDMMMPGRSGFDVLAELRRDGTLDPVPVVVLTASAQAADAQAALDAGADRFLTKPFSPLELKRLVEELLAERGAGRAPAH